MGKVDGLVRFPASLAYPRASGLGNLTMDGCAIGKAKVDNGKVHLHARFFPPTMWEKIEHFHVECNSLPPSLICFKLYCNKFWTEFLI